MKTIKALSVWGLILIGSLFFIGLLGISGADPTAAIGVTWGLGIPILFGFAQAIGSKGQIIFQQETTFKTDPGSPDAKKLHFVSEGLKLSRELLTTNIIRSNRNPVMPVRGNIDVAGSISTHLQVYQLGSILKGLLGASRTTSVHAVSTAYALNALVTPATANGYYYKATAAGTSAATAPTWPTVIGNTVVDGTVTWRCEGVKAASAYVYELFIGDAVPSFLIEKGFTDIAQYFKYNGCKINKAGLSVTPAGFQEMSFDIIGAKETVGSSSFDSTPVDGSYRAFDGFSIAVIQEGGANIANVSGIDGLSIENNLDGSVYVVGGAGERNSLPEGVVKISGTVKAMFENLTLYTKAINNTESSLKVAYKFGDGAGTANNEYLEFYIPELKYSPNAPVISGPTGIYTELPFEAYYENDAAASAIQILIKNTETAL